MTTSEKLAAITAQKRTLLCVGLDTDAALLPDCLEKTPAGMVEFNRTIIEYTKPFAAAYKINVAFYEQYGWRGWQAFEETRSLLPDGAISIVDAKRGDMGNTNDAYARTFYEYLNFDSVTASPYLGFDSVEAFLLYEGKLTFVLALTSNPGSADFQRCLIHGKPLYRKVIERCMEYRGAGGIGFVVGATHPEELRDIRSMCAAPLLIPGVGTQGGKPDEVMAANGAFPALVNVSRHIIYASKGEDFGEKAGEMARSFASELQV